MLVIHSMNKLSVFEIQEMQVEQHDRVQLVSLNSLKTRFLVTLSCTY